MTLTETKNRCCISYFISHFKRQKLIFKFKLPQRRCLGLWIQYEKSVQQARIASLLDYFIFMCAGLA
jgi:hypothetical protein